MSGILRQNTAVTLLVGPFLDSVDGNTEETALTIAQADVRLSKNGAASAPKADTSSATHDANGMYRVSLNATDTDTVGRLTLFVHVSGALFVRHEYQVVEEAVYDQFYASDASGVANLDVAVSSRASPSQVKAEVVDALATDTYGEPGQGAPPATASLAQKIGYLFKAWRNRHTQTATEYALYNDAGTTKDQKASVSDDGTTFERGEVQSGP